MKKNILAVILIFLGGAFLLYLIYKNLSSRNFMHDLFEPTFDGIYTYIGIFVILLGIFFIRYMSKCALTITEDRVVGKASFRRYVDIPIKNVLEVSFGAFNCIRIGTPAGHIRFWLIENREEVYSVLKDHLKKVQDQ